MHWCEQWGWYCLTSQLLTWTLWKTKCYYTKKLNMTHKYTYATEKANSLLVALRGVFLEGWGKLSFPSVLVSMWSTVSTSGVASTWEIWTVSSEGPWRWWKNWRASAVRSGWELVLLGLLQRKIHGKSVIPINAWRQGVKMMEPRCFWWCTAPGQEAMGTNWNTGVYFWIQGSTSLLRGWWSTGTVYPETL